ncbi:MAG: FGGY family carbohydrate kinase, partial [Kineosporiaceae bacterium]
VPAGPAGSRAVTAVEVVVGVDVGTTETKALVVGTDGTELAGAAVPTAWRRDGAEAETTADRLRDGMVATVRAALAAAADHGGRGVRGVGVGLTGMAESGVLLDPSGAVRAPVIGWFDPRGEAELARLPADVLAALPATTGMAVSPLCTAAKLAWLRGRGLGPGRGSRWRNVPEHLACTLGGEPAAEPSLASRTGLFDQATGVAWAGGLAAVGAPADLFGTVVAAGTSLGRVTDPALPELAGAHVVVAGHDHPVASVGAGAWEDDDLFDSFGTAESVLRSLSAPLTGEQRRRLVGAGLTAGSHVIEDRWVVSGPTRAGMVLRRVLDLLGCTDPAARDRLDAAWRPRPGPAPAVVSGAAMTDADVTVRLRDDRAGPEVVWAAALEHTSTAVAALAAQIDAEVGTRRRVVAAGGWTRLAGVRGAKALSMPDVVFSPRRQAGAYGAATLAAWAAAGRRGAAADFARGFQRAPVPDTPLLTRAGGHP